MFSLICKLTNLLFFVLIAAHHTQGDWVAGCGGAICHNPGKTFLGKHHCICDKWYWGIA